LAATPVRHEALQTLPLLPVLVDQRDQLQVLLNGPFPGIQVGTEVVFIVILELLEVPP